MIDFNFMSTGTGEKRRTNGGDKEENQGARGKSCRG